MYLIFGLILFGLGETLLVSANIGVSSWFVLHQGISVKTGYTIGTTTFIVSIIVLFIWIPLKQKPGIGTILNVIIIPLVTDLSLPHLPYPEIFLLQLLQVIIGVIIVGLGSSFYLIANLGPGARDGLMTGTPKITKLSLSLARTLIEFSVLAMSWYLGGIVVIGTVIYALGIGQFVTASFFFVGKYVK